MATFSRTKKYPRVICTICWYDVADGEQCLPHTCGHPWTTRQLFIQLISVLTIALATNEKIHETNKKSPPLTKRRTRISSVNLSHPFKSVIVCKKYLKLMKAWQCEWCMCVWGPSQPINRQLAISCSNKAAAECSTKTPSFKSTFNSSILMSRTNRHFYRASEPDWFKIFPALLENVLD